MSWIDKYLDDYYKFLKEKTKVTDLPTGNWVEISTPFLNLFNDSIDIYAQRNNGKVLLSDDGQTIKNLELGGIEFSHSPKRRDLLDGILLNYGIKFDKDKKELFTDANENNFPQKKLNLISAISEANDLFVLAKHSVASIFREDVKQYLDDNEIIYTPYFISKGSIGLEFTFDFQIAYKKLEILIKAFNSVNKLNLPHFLFTWDDVKQVRERQTEKKVIGLAVINNEEKEIKEEYLEALQSKNAESILWTERNKSENLRKLKPAA